MCSLGVSGGGVSGVEVVSSLDSGFKQLSDLIFTAVHVTPPLLIGESALERRNRIPLKSIMAAWEMEPTDAGQLADRLFSHFDPTTLGMAKLLRSAVCNDSLSWLSTCTTLHTLQLTLAPHQIATEFPVLLSHLPRFRSLKAVMVYHSDSGDINSPVRLSTILTSLPPSLCGFSAPRFIFPDAEALPVRPIPRPPFSGLRAVMGQQPASPRTGVRTTTSLIVWGEKSQGITSWSRNTFDNFFEDEPPTECEWVWTAVLLNAAAANGSFRVFAEYLHPNSTSSNCDLLFSFYYGLVPLSSFSNSRSLSTQFPSASHRLFSDSFSTYL
jgi:hypothetical protein